MLYKMVNPWTTLGSHLTASLGTVEPFKTIGTLVGIWQASE